MKRLDIPLLICLLLYGGNNGFAQTNAIPATIPTATAQTNSVRLADRNEPTIKVIAPFVQAITSVANLILVGYLFFCTERSRKRDRLTDFLDRQDERKVRAAAFWVEELIMRPNHNFLHTFFDSTEAMVKSKRNPTSNTEITQLREHASQEIIRFKSNFHRVRHLVVDPLCQINADFNALVELMRQIEDTVTTELARFPGLAAIAPEYSPEPVEDRLSKLRRDFFLTIHEIHVASIQIRRRD